MLYEDMFTGKLDLLYKAVRIIINIMFVFISVIDTIGNVGDYCFVVRLKNLKKKKKKKTL